MDLQLLDKRALVTGGSKGIGKAIARRLALEGADVVVASRGLSELRATASELALQTGRRILPLTVDTADDLSVKDLVAGCVEALGGLDILVNAAAMPGGQGPAPKLAEITDDTFWDDVDVKVMGYLRTSREAAPHMIAHGWGRIVNVSGLAARQTGSIIGSIRNVAVSALTKNLADELGPKGVNVTAVHPGLTRTERTARRVSELAREWDCAEAEVVRRLAASVSIGRLVDAEEVADVVTFLASPRSVSINGDTVPCGGGTKGAIHY